MQPRLGHLRRLVGLHHPRSLLIAVAASVRAPYQRGLRPLDRKTVEAEAANACQRVTVHQHAGGQRGMLAARVVRAMVASMVVKASDVVLAAQVAPAAVHRPVAAERWRATVAAQRAGLEDFASERIVGSAILRDVSFRQAQEQSAPVAAAKCRAVARRRLRLHGHRLRARAHPDAHVAHRLLSPGTSVPFSL